MSGKESILITLTVLILCFLVLFILFSDKGFIDLNLLKNEKNKMIERTETLVLENRSLYREIERLKHDPKYIEDIARKELGVIGKNEVILKPQQKIKKAGND